MKSVTIVITFLLICYSNSKVYSQKNTTKFPEYGQIDSLFNSLFKADKTGASFAIIKDGKTQYQKSIGLANLEHGIPVTKKTVFPIASVSKQFTSFLALSLEKEGKLSMKDNIKKYLPELKMLPDNICLENLANHTHGLPNIHELAGLKGIFPNKAMNHREIVAFLLKIRTVNFEAGTQYQYGNTGFILLAEIIERIEKKPFPEILKERIFAPLQMNNSAAITDMTTIVPNKAYSYRSTNGGYEVLPATLTAVGSAGINTTIEDFSKWAQYFQKSPDATQSIFQKMQVPTVLKNRRQIGYGLGLQFETYKGIDIVFHGGGNAGYTSYILHAPKQKLSMVIMTNTNNFLGFDMIYGAIDLLLKPYFTNAPKKSKPTKATLKKFAGVYEFQPGNYFELLEKNGVLHFRSFGSEESAPLPHLTGTTYTFPFIPYSKIHLSDGKFDFRIADFTYECPKIETPNLSKITVNVGGTYFNDAFNIYLKIIIEDGKVYVIRESGAKVLLQGKSENCMFAQPIGEFNFHRDELGAVKAFKLSGQNFKGLTFLKK